MGITKIATYKFADDANVESTQSEAWQLVNKGLQMLVSENPQSAAYFGQITENPRQTQLICDEALLDKMSERMMTDENKTFREKLTPTHGPITKPLRVEFFNFVDEAVTAPCTEVVTMYVPPDMAQGQWTRDVWDHFSWVLENYAEGLVNLVGGWVLDAVEKDGKEYKAFAALVGWSSYDAHMKFRESKAFKNNVGELIDGCAAIDMHHVSFKVISQDANVEQAASA